MYRALTAQIMRLDTLFDADDRNEGMAGIVGKTDDCSYSLMYVLRFTSFFYDHGD